MAYVEGKDHCTEMLSLSNSLQSQWLVVVGIGENGTDGLSQVAQSLISTANTLLGSTRHLKQIATLIPATAECLPWASLTTTLAAIKARRGHRVVVLASGDPMLYGIGVTLSHYIPFTEMIVVPHISAFSLAAARLGWPLQDVETLSVHGRPLESLALHFAHGVRLLVLSKDGNTPSRVSVLLKTHGFGPSHMTVLEHMGGPNEHCVSGSADSWHYQLRVANLNTLAIECVAASGQKMGWGRGTGLPDEAYQHDGQLTKREIRAATLAALTPRPGELLWDIGAGAGSIAIEWLRTHHTTEAVAVEQKASRVAAIAVNAARLGVPHLYIIHGSAPVCFPQLPKPPTAVFVGGGISVPGLLEACWEVLSKNGRMVVNAVTLESEARLIAWRAAHGGTLIRLSITQLRSLGTLSTWSPAAPVTQYHGLKSV